MTNLEFEIWHKKNDLSEFENCREVIEWYLNNNCTIENFNMKRKDGGLEFNILFIDNNENPIQAYKPQ